VRVPLDILIIITAMISYYNGYGYHHGHYHNDDICLMVPPWCPLRRLMAGRPWCGCRWTSASTRARCVLVLPGAGGKGGSLPEAMLLEAGPDGTIVGAIVMTLAHT
jgi:hypothetical protein